MADKSRMETSIPSVSSDLNWKEFFGSSMSLTNGLLELYDEIQTEVSHRLQSVKSCTGKDDIEDRDADAPSGGTSTMNVAEKFDSVNDGHLESTHTGKIHLVTDGHLEATHDGKTEPACDGHCETTDRQNIEPIVNEHHEILNNSELGQTNELLGKDIVVDKSEGSICPRSGRRFLSKDSVVDDKKRPLSITSTSSSSSASTCSLTRHQRKKFSNNGASPSRCLASDEHLCQMDEDDSADVLSTVDEHYDQQSCMDTEESKAESNPIVASSDEKYFSDNNQLKCDSQHNRVKSSLKNLCERDNVNQCDNDVTSSDYVTPTTSGEDIAGMGIELHGKEYIDRVILEIIQSEKAYVNDLKDVILGYMIYMWNTPELNVSKEDKELLFGNIDAIYNFNQRFLCCLENCENSPREISACFIRHKDGFNIYSDFCTNYPRSIEVFKRCMRNPCLATALKQQQLAMRHGLPLESYLLKPVQRVMKYHLFLQNMLNNHGSHDDEHDVIQRAYDAMLEVAERINEMKRFEEEDVRQQQQHNVSSRSCLVQSEQQNNDLGHLILQDKFRMHRAKSLRQVYLFSKALLIGKKKDDGSFSVKAIIQSCDLMLIESVPNDPLCFHILPFSCPKQQYTLQAKDIEQKRLWCQHIKRMILENYNAVIPDKAKELVMELGNSQTDGKDDMKIREKSIDSKRRQHCAPEYLERRRTRQKGSFILPDFKLKSRKGSRRSLEQMSSKQRLIPVPGGQSDSETVNHLSPQHREIEMSQYNVSPTPESHIKQDLLSPAASHSSNPSTECQRLSFDASLQSTNQQLDDGNDTSVASSIQTLHSLSAESCSSIINNTDTTDSNETLPDFSLESINENIVASTPIGITNAKHEPCNITDDAKANDLENSLDVEIEPPDFEDPWLLRDGISQRVENSAMNGSTVTTVIPIKRQLGKFECDNFRKSHTSVSQSTSQKSSERKRIVIPIQVVGSTALKSQINTCDNVPGKVDGMKSDSSFRRSTSEISDIDSLCSFEKSDTSHTAKPSISSKYFVKESSTIEDISSKQVELKSYQRRSPTKLISEKSEEMRCSNSFDQSMTSSDSGSLWDESQHRIVRQFNKLYANRKNNGLNSSAHAMKELNRFLKEAQPGGSVIGSRMALAINSSPGDMFTIAPPKHKGKLSMTKSVTDSSICSNISPMLQQKCKQESSVSYQDCKSISSGKINNISSPQQYKLEVNVEVLEKSGKLSASLIKLSDSMSSLNTSSESVSTHSNSSKSTSIEQITSKLDVRFSADDKTEISSPVRDSKSGVYEIPLTVIPDPIEKEQCKRSSADSFYEEQLMGTLECLNASDSTLSLDNYSLNDISSPVGKQSPALRIHPNKQHSLTSIDITRCGSPMNGRKVSNLAERMQSFSDKSTKKDDTLCVMNVKERERRRELASCASVVRMRRDGLSYDKNEVSQRRRSRSLTMDKYRTSPEL